MEFSAFLVFAVWTSSMTCLTFGKERERAMVFPDYYFFAERRLENHTIEKKRVNNLDDCELMCYLNDDCVSLNFKKDPENNESVHICELNNAIHLKYDIDLTTDANFYYRGSKNACDKSPYCKNNATCQSGFTLKGYRCLCPPGFEGEYCEKDIDECKTYPDKCHVNATCNNTQGSHVCKCKPGYTGDGRNCTDVDECNGNHSCHEDAKCTNTIGSHVCECQPGYTGNGQNCTDIDECKGNHSCHEDANCTNSNGSYVCDCQPGYTGNGQNCTDIDECKTYPDKCHVNALCHNTHGSHVCTCKPGYTGDGRNCTDIDECSKAHTVKMNNCDPNASCTNIQGSYNCSCKPKYIGNGLNCKADPCHHYRNLSEANRNKSYETPYGSELCDKQLPEGWYRFVGAAGTKMPTTHVPAFRCGTVYSGWLDGAHPTVEDGEAPRTVCFSQNVQRTIECKRRKTISVKNCGSYFIYKLSEPLKCPLRYCGTD